MTALHALCAALLAAYVLGDLLGRYLARRAAEPRTQVAAP